jgi:AraC family transcriptional regulator
VRFSPASLVANENLPGRRLHSSEELGWNFPLLEVFEQPEVAEFTTSATPDLLVVATVRGWFHMESRADELWHSVPFGRGTMALTSPGTTCTLRWRGSSAGARTTLHVHLPAELIEQTRADMPFSKHVDELNVPALADPAAGALVAALHTALNCRAASLVAESLALALAAQLLTRPKGRTERSATPSAALSAPALGRVIDYMNAHLQNPINLEDLAREANLSKYHFLRVFVATVGMTPHRYLTEMRMERAAQLLSSGRPTVTSVAGLCGYASTARFAEAFRRRYGTTPGAYRSSLAPVTTPISPLAPANRVGRADGRQGLPVRGKAGPEAPSGVDRPA